MEDNKRIDPSCLKDHLYWEKVQQTSCSQSFSFLFDRYWEILYGTAFSYLKDREKSEEITHDIFLNLWQKRETLIIQSFPAYLRAAARYHVYKELKKRKTSAIVYMDELTETGGAMTNQGEERLIYQDAERYVDGSLQTLPARCQEIYFMSRKENLTNDEIANKLGISKRTVENQLTVALRHIRILLKAVTTVLFFIILL
ncbi:RNA polymerase sigma-70 factor [Sphingobacterium chuzhouense]|uniref:RNA polymerase sigma-70 factor n=1 Tax=Sphingobacterium chuzhouense TaxID=1742264 RepID=A0ABR7XW36_9SPHI|nr:RNA polymerase sigma-70 factor [Sphingobacterium chuzhouense]MBD1423266.1 RNA polymerase sigma-70 factor [Sphingobacterium chuzhouense]